MRRATLWFILAALVSSVLPLSALAAPQTVNMVDGIGMLDYSKKPTFKVGDWVKYHFYGQSDAGEKISNYSYFPILVEADYPISRNGLYEKLKDNRIHARRYFSPLISDFPMYRGLPSAHKENLPVATAAAQQILCLPIYSDLDMSVVDEIIRFIAAQ